jgi:peptidyl-tRNA hydrolase
MIAGLGNPGREYVRTPHNAGFEAVDCLAEKLGASWRRENRFRADIAKATAPNGEQLLLLKPLTYMNASGESIGETARYYKIAPEDTIVLCDDINFPAGDIRIRATGGAGGHNGLKSIISHLGTQDFPRVRIGAGTEGLETLGMVDFVLGKISSEAAQPIAEGITAAAEAALMILSDGVPAAMNKHNKKVLTPEEAAKKEAKEAARKAAKEAAKAAKEAAEKKENPAAAEASP